MKTLVLSVLLAAAPAAAQTIRPVVAVTGVGRVAVVPNVARLTITITDAAKLTTQVPALVAQNQTRVAPTVAYVKEIVGKQGEVTVTPQIQKDFQYDRQSGENKLIGNKVVTTIEIELRGKAAIADKLGKLYDSSKIKADDISAPSMDLTDSTRAAAQRRALKLAARNAREQARAQLEPGESLGQAQERGNGASVPSPRHAAKSMARLAAAESMDDGGGAAAVQTGKLWVTAAANFVFDVLGTPLRLAAKIADAK